jgi:hypothetical protein
MLIILRRENQHDREGFFTTKITKHTKKKQLNFVFFPWPAAGQALCALWSSLVAAGVALRFVSLYNCRVIKARKIYC